MLGMLGALIFALVMGATSADYWQDRARFIELEESQAVGASIKLSDKENLVNKFLMKHKLGEFEEGLESPAAFLPSQHFFKSRAKVEASEVFKFIQKLPKGAALHGHDTALASEQFVYNLTFRDNLYGCVVGERLKLHFFDKVQDKTCNWTLLAQLRKQPGFEAFIKSQLTLIVSNPEQEYPDINAAWKRFMDIFSTVTPMLTYKPVFQEYFYQTLKELHEDNVLYLEFRGTLPGVYDLTGRTYGPEEVIGLYEETANQFLQDYPTFGGVRFIYGPSRSVDNKTADYYLATAAKLKKSYPDFLAGFDLVGQEDKGKPLRSFVKQILDMPKGMDFFFHAGETNWYGATDFNLVDAVLLGTKRIGHGYAILKHPQVAKLVKERGIAIEICPISNQVLELIGDLRNHPVASLIAQNYPVVISSDDPSFWGVKGLSYDWYMAFMGMASKNADLRFLKQLALNSLNYSSLPAAQKKTVLDRWNVQWNNFIRGVIRLHKLRRRHHNEDNLV